MPFPSRCFRFFRAFLSPAMLLICVFGAAQSVITHGQWTGSQSGRAVHRIAFVPQAAVPAATPPRGPFVSLALHKPATQSSVYRGTGIDQGPQFGNDGILESKPRDPYLLVMTDADNPPWWQVDLQGVYTLTQLKLYNRKACCQERAKTIQVLLSTDGAHWERAYAHNGTTFDVLTVDLTGRTARYVRLQLTERVQLHFQECEVYGYANTPSTVSQTAVPAATHPSQSTLNVSIRPAQQEIPDSGENVSTVAEVTGGVPPYSYQWYNGDKVSKVTSGEVVWSNIHRPGTRDIRVVVTDSAGNTGEAHASITVRAAGEQAPQPPPPNPSQPPAVAPPSSGPVNIAGTWQHGARGETWTFTALDSNRYEAREKGFGNAVGVATVIGNRFRIDFTFHDGGEHYGYYQMTVEPSGGKATGRFRDDRAREGPITMTRTTGP